jgi:hypothetical protein
MHEDKFHRISHTSLVASGVYVPLYTFVRFCALIQIAKKNLRVELVSDNNKSLFPADLIHRLAFLETFIIRMKVQWVIVFGLQFYWKLTEIVVVTSRQLVHR